MKKLFWKGFWESFKAVSGNIIAGLFFYKGDQEGK